MNSLLTTITGGLIEVFASLAGIRTHVKEIPRKAVTHLESKPVLDRLHHVYHGQLDKTDGVFAPYK